MAKKVSATKRKLLDISKRLIIEKGYNATTVEEICTQAEVTKGAFFYYFKSKEELGISVLRDYWESRQREFAESDWMEQTTPLAQLQAFLVTVADVFTSDANGYSCLAGIFTQELATTNPTIQSIVSELFAEWSEQIKPVLQQASQGKSVDISALADHIVVVVEGAIILALARQDKRVITRQLEMLSQHLQIVLSA